MYGVFVVKRFQSGATFFLACFLDRNAASEVCCFCGMTDVGSWLGATTHPTAEWIARQLTEACGWDEAPRYLVRDRDRSYGEVFVRRVRAMGIKIDPHPRGRRGRTHMRSS